MELDLGDEALDLVVRQFAPVVAIWGWKVLLVAGRIGLHEALHSLLTAVRNGKGERG